MLVTKMHICLFQTSLALAIVASPVKTPSLRLRSAGLLEGQLHEEGILHPGEGGGNWSAHMWGYA